MKRRRPVRRFLDIATGAGKLDKYELGREEYIKKSLAASDTIHEAIKKIREAAKKGELTEEQRRAAINFAIAGSLESLKLLLNAGFVRSGVNYSPDKLRYRARLHEKQSRMLDKIANSLEKGVKKQDKKIEKVVGISQEINRRQWIDDYHGKHIDSINMMAEAYDKTGPDIREAVSNYRKAASNLRENAEELNNWAYQDEKEIRAGKRWYRKKKIKEKMNNLKTFLKR